MTSGKNFDQIEIQFKNLIEKIRQVHFLDALAVLTALLQRQAMRAGAARKSANSDICAEARLDSDALSSEKEAAASANSQRAAADAAAEKNAEKTAAASAGASVQSESAAGSPQHTMPQQMALAASDSNFASSRANADSTATRAETDDASADDDWEKLLLSERDCTDM